MSFLDFSQKVSHFEFPFPKKMIVLADKCILRATLSYPATRSNWLTCGAMAVKFGRVALPIGFDSLSVEEQHDMAEELAGEYFKQFCRKLPYEAMIERYRLCKNKNVITVINVAYSA